MLSRLLACKLRSEANVRVEPQARTSSHHHARSAVGFAVAAAGHVFAMRAIMLQHVLVQFSQVWGESASCIGAEFARKAALARAHHDKQRPAEQ